jgi:hypothetical protein
MNKWLTYIFLQKLTIQFLFIFSLRFHSNGQENRIALNVEEEKEEEERIFRLSKRFYKLRFSKIVGVCTVSM